MSRLIRDHQRDREQGVGTVSRSRIDVIRELMEAASGTEAEAWLRAELAKATAPKSGPIDFHVDDELQP